MEKRMNSPLSKTVVLFLCAVVMTALVLGASTEALAKKKKGPEDTAKSAVAAVDINTADQKTLEAVPGMGKATAAAIIKGRPYKSVDDLKRVKGMSDAKLKTIRDRVTVGGSAPVPAAPASAPAAAEKTPKDPAAVKTAPEKTKTVKSAAKLAPGQRININTAAKDELDVLPGIGPVKAQAIIDNRPYQKPEDIMKVKGIKQKEFEKIKDSITVR